jgi:hypothetical protein
MIGVGLLYVKKGSRRAVPVPLSRKRIFVIMPRVFSKAR